MSAFRRSGGHHQDPRAADQATANGTHPAADGTHPTADGAPRAAATPPAAPAGRDIPPGYSPAGTGDRSPGDGDVHALWEARTRVFLQPIAGPSIIGLFGFMGATLMVGAWQAGWYGDAATPAIIFPFVIFFGGVMQGGAAFSSLKARDGLAAATHATWGGFWLGWGLLWALTVGGLLPAVPLGAANDSMAMWFVVLCSITLMLAIAASFFNFNIAGVLWTLAAGSGLTAAGMWGGYLNVTHVGGILFVISAGIAWYAATAMVLQGMFGRTILPIFRPSAAAVIPGRRPIEPIQYSDGMPGVRVGQ